MNLSHMKKIRLPQEQDGHLIWRTLEGEWLAGIDSGRGEPALGSLVYGHDAGMNGQWFVIRAASGKLVVYHRVSNTTSPGAIAIYDSFEAMEPHVPAQVFEEAAIRAGLRKPKDYPEAPLDV